MSAAAKKALRLAELGLPVFPVHPLSAGKRAKTPYRGHGHLDATIDAAEVKRMWKAHPDALPAVWTGAAGLVVHDGDAPPGAPAWHEVLAEKGIQPEPTPLAYPTPSGGMHRFYAEPQGVPIPNGAAPVGDLVSNDRRSGSSYVVFWGDPPATMPVLPPAPAWLLADDKPPAAKAKRGTRRDLEAWIGDEEKAKPRAWHRAAVECVPTDSDDVQREALLTFANGIVAAGLDGRARGWMVDTFIERWTTHPDGVAKDVTDALAKAIAGAPAPLKRTLKLQSKVPTGAGTAVLDDVRDLLERHIAYPNAWASTAHALWIAHAHIVRDSPSSSSPRLAFLSPEKGSGKTRALEVTEALTPRALIVVNASTSAIFRSLGADDLPTLLFDEVDAVFLGKSESAEELRGILNSGYRRGAYALRSVVRGKGEVTVEEWPTYSAVALAGLGMLPDTLQSRSIVIHMKRRAGGTTVAPWRERIHVPIANGIRAKLAAYMSTIRRSVRDAEPALPEGVDDREADLWEPLLAIADAVGGDWPQCARDAAVAAVAERSSGPASLGVQLLADVRRVLGERDRIRTENLLGELIALDESPWGSLRGQPIDSRFLAKTLAKYDVSPVVIRVEDGTARGYRRADFHDAWSRYLPASSHLSQTFATPGKD